MKINATLLSQLFFFEKSATCSSFTQASQQLNVTTGAVSQQIRNLESTLNISLFNRHSRGISLTAQGTELHRVVSGSINDIEQCLSRLTQQTQQDNEIHLKLTPSFAFKWLMPRLHSFYNQHPNITVTTYADSGLVNYDEQGYDLAIDYQKIPFEHNKAQLILEEYLIPVMSPAYFAQLNTTTKEFDKKAWQQCALLHDSMVWPKATKTQEWQEWFAKRQLTLPTSNHYYFNRTDMAMAAAEAGMGVALARRALIADELTDQRLVSPFTAISAEAGYYLIEHNKSAATDKFKTWLFIQLNTC